MIEYSVRGGHLSFNVKVVPRASRSELAGEQDGALRVRIAAPPVAGAANEELRRVLAKKLKLKSGAISIVSGHNSRTKRLMVEGISAEDFEKLIFEVAKRQ